MTDVLRVDPRQPDHALIARAAECLRKGGLVAFPTETVYGLGAHALEREAILRVFAVKERPANDPLIVHVATLEDAIPLVTAVPQTARALAARFWPGPLTIVLGRSRLVPAEVTAGRETVAIRVPSHPVARALLEAARVPVAAPSANLFSRPSPTRASHVLADLNGRIDMIVDAGPTDVGLESTVVDLLTDPPAVLRPGAIGIDALRAVLPNVTTHSKPESGDGAMRSPGMLARHYSPRTPVIFHEGDRETALGLMKSSARSHIDRGESVVVLAYADDLAELQSLPVHLVELGSEQNPEAVAARLYAAMREGDEVGAHVILVRAGGPPHPLNQAIRDRLVRAAAGGVTSVTRDS